jgi:ribosome-associated translation inhibitor RaiA
VKESNPDFETAVDAVVETLQQMVRKTKDKQSDRRHVL